MRTTEVAALGRRHGRHAFLRWGVSGDAQPAEPPVEKWRRSLHCPPAAGEEGRLYDWAFRAAWTEAYESRQRAARRLDPLEDA